VIETLEVTVALHCINEFIAVNILTCMNSKGVLECSFPCIDMFAAIHSRLNISLLSFIINHNNRENRPVLLAPCLSCFNSCRLIIIFKRPDFSEQPENYSAFWIRGFYFLVSVPVPPIISSTRGLCVFSGYIKSHITRSLPISFLVSLLEIFTFSPPKLSSSQIYGLVSTGYSQ